MCVSVCMCMDYTGAVILAFARVISTCGYNAARAGNDNALGT